MLVYSYVAGNESSICKIIVCMIEQLC